MSTSKNQQDFPHAKPLSRAGAKLLRDAPHDTEEFGLLGEDISVGAAMPPPPPPPTSADTLRARLRRAEREPIEPRTTLSPMPLAPPRSAPSLAKRWLGDWSAAKLAFAFAFGGLSGTSVYSLAERAHAQQVPTLNNIESRALAATADDVEPASAKAEGAPPPTAASAPELGASAEPEEFSPDALDPRHAAELALLRKARAQLRAGEPFSAQLTLQQLAQRFPHGKWAQRREVLAIEVQRVVGPPSAAKRAARAFAQAHPYSPHIGPLKPLLLDE